MPNPGTPSGLTAELGWHSYQPTQPILVCFSLTGAVTQPLLGASSVVAHYQHEKQTGTVRYQGFIQFSSDATFGSSDQVWGVRLPVPAYRSLGGADVPIGNGYAWQGSAGNRNMPLRATLMDPLGFGGGAQTNEDYFCQFFLPYMLATGSGAITSAATSTTITHGLGTTPNAFDIQIMPTATTTNNIVMYYVDTITSTQFNVNVRTAPGASTFAFNWKARCEPNGVAAFDLLVNSGRPFGGGWASGYLLGWNVEYQARR